MAPQDHPLCQKLSRSIALSEAEAITIAGVPVTRRSLRRGEAIVRQGDRPTNCFIVIDGLTCREKIVVGDRRQISAINVPDDLPDLQGVFLDMLDHNIIILQEGVDCIVDDLIRGSPASTAIGTELGKNNAHMSTTLITDSASAAFQPDYHF